MVNSYVGGRGSRFTPNRFICQGVVQAGLGDEIYPDEIAHERQAPTRWLILRDTDARSSGDGFSDAVRERLGHVIGPFFTGKLKT